MALEGDRHRILLFLFIIHTQLPFFWMLFWGKRGKSHRQNVPDDDQKCTKLWTGAWGCDAGNEDELCIVNDQFCGRNPTVMSPT